MRDELPQSQHYAVGVRPSVQALLTGVVNGAIWRLTAGGCVLLVLNHLLGA